MSKRDAPYPYNLLEDILDKPQNDELDADQLKGLEYAISTLTQREQDCINTYCKSDLTFDEMRGTYHITRGRIWQIYRKALRKLRHPTRWKYIEIGYAKPSGELEQQADERRKKLLESLNAEYDARILDIRRKIGRADKILAELNGLDTIKTAEQFLDAVDTPIENFDFSVRTYNSLSRAGIKTITRLCACDMDKLRTVRNLGNKSIQEIVDKLAQYGLKIKEQD